MEIQKLFHHTCAPPPPIQRRLEVNKYIELTTIRTVNYDHQIIYPSYVGMSKGSCMYRGAAQYVLKMGPRLLLTQEAFKSMLCQHGPSMTTEMSPEIATHISLPCPTVPAIPSVYNVLST